MILCWHRYTRWSPVAVTKDGDPVQHKECVKCGKAKIRVAW